MICRVWTLSALMVLSVTVSRHAVAQELPVRALVDAFQETCWDAAPHFERISPLAEARSWAMFSEVENTTEAGYHVNDEEIKAWRLGEGLSALYRVKDLKKEVEKTCDVELDTFDGASLRDLKSAANAMKDIVGKDPAREEFAEDRLGIFLEWSQENGDLYDHIRFSGNRGVYAIAVRVMLKPEEADPAACEPGDEGDASTEAETCESAE